MKYLVLLMDDGDEQPWNEMTEDAQGALMVKFEAFSLACEARDGVQILAGEALTGPETSTMMRTRSGQVSLTEGPFVEAIEHMGGFYLVQAPDLDVLTGLLTELPAYDIQIWPALEMPE